VRTRYEYIEERGQKIVASAGLGVKKKSDTVLLLVETLALDSLDTVELGPWLSRRIRDEIPVKGGCRKKIHHRFRKQSLQ